MKLSKSLNADDELRQAVREGLSNHTGEFANPWIFRKNYSHEEMADILEDIMASKRLFDNLQKLIQADSKKRELQAIIKELGWAKTASVWNIDVRVAELKQELEKL